MWARFTCSSIHIRNKRSERDERNNTDDRNNNNEGMTVIVIRETTGLLPQQTLAGMTETTGMKYMWCRG